MKHLAFVFPLCCILVLCACSTFEAIEGSPEEVRRQIVSEHHLSVGDTVKIVTADATAHEFRITRIDVEEGSVSGEHDSVLLAEIISLEKRERGSWRKVNMAIGIGYVVGIVLVLTVGGPLVL